jgi:hypothetical protein
MHLTVVDLKARITRLEQLTRGLAREVEIQSGAEDLLLAQERKQYFKAVQDALAGAEGGRVVLTGVVSLKGQKRMPRGVILPGGGCVPVKACTGW